MNKHSRNRSVVCRIGLISVVISVLLAVPVMAQVPDPIYVDPNYPGSSAPSEGNRDAVTTPNLSNLNQNADTMQYVDRESGPINVGVDLKTGFADNLFNAPGDKQPGYFSGFGVPVGLRLHSPLTLFNANYRIDKVFYPQFTQVDNTSQTYEHQLEHHASEHNTYFWNLAAGKLTAIGQYLPTLIEIGGTGVTQGSVGTGVQQNSYVDYNAVTSVGFSHLISEKDLFAGTLTGGWLEQAQNQVNAGSQRRVLRNDIGGLDLRYERAASPSSKLGVELTNLYIRGLEPRGHTYNSTVELTYGFNLNSHLDLHVAGGPLFSTSSTGNDSGSQHISELSYAASGGIGYTVQHSRMELGFARVLQLSYIQTATAAYQISALFDRELTPTIDLTLDGRYVRSDSSSVFLRESQFGLTGRVNKRIGSNVLLFVSASRAQQRVPGALQGTDASFDRDDVFGGVTVVLGNPIYHRGAR